MSARADEHRRAQRRVLIGFVVLVVLIAGVIYARRSKSQPPVQELPEVALNGAVSCSGDAIQVTNNDSANWLDARVEINSKYSRIVPSIPPRETITLPTSELTDSNSQPFNPASMKCQSADIQAFLHGSRGHLEAANLQ